MKKKPAKLVLKHETVRMLHRVSLTQVAGGFTGGYGDCSDVTTFVKVAADRGNG